MSIQDLVHVGTRTFGRLGLRAQKHSPHILVGVGVVGVVTAGVMAARATLKLEDVVTEHEVGMEDIEVHYQTNGGQENAKRKDITRLYGATGTELVKLYGPSITLGAVSIAAILGGHRILHQRNVALIGAYKALETTYTEYRKRVADAIGEEKEAVIHENLTKEKVKGKDGKTKTVTVQNPGGMSQYARFFDEYNLNYVKGQPDYNKTFLLAQQRYMNDLLVAKGHVFLNEVYDALGMERSPAGSQVGWVLNKGGDNYISFGLDEGNREMVRAFVNGDEASVLLDFNVDGVMWNLI